MNQTNSEVTFIEPLTHIMMILLLIDRTCVWLSDVVFRKNINVSNKMFFCSLKQFCRENITLYYTGVALDCIDS